VCVWVCKWKYGSRGDGTTMRCERYFFLILLKPTTNSQTSWHKSRKLLCRPSPTHWILCNPWKNPQTPGRTVTKSCLAVSSVFHSACICAAAAARLVVSFCLRLKHKQWIHSQSHTHTHTPVCEYVECWYSEREPKKQKQRQVELQQWRRAFGKSASYN